MKNYHSFDVNEILHNAMVWWDGKEFDGDRWLRHDQMLQMFSKVNYKSNTIGTSFEGKSINEYLIGSGSRGFIGWSQMHGNEATATYAIHDLLLYLQLCVDEDWYDEVFRRVHVRLIPMVNPDGAERWTRRTAQGIDPNRDAVAQVAKETQLLMSRVRASGAELALNLHDQRDLFHLEGKKESAVISFLAPSTDKDRGMNPVRRKAMNWVSHFHKRLKDFHEPGAGRYTDEFYPTAFGENVQKMGIPTVLIESGAWPNDSQRKLARKLNFHILLNAILTLSDSHIIDQYPKSDYDTIPLNSNKQWGFLVRNVRIGKEESLLVDLGIEFKYYPNRAEGALYRKAVVGDIGDLSAHVGLDELDAKGAWFERGSRQVHLDDPASFTLYRDGLDPISIENGQIV